MQEVIRSEGLAGPHPLDEQPATHVTQMADEAESVHVRRQKRPPNQRWQRSWGIREFEFRGRLDRARSVESIQIAFDVQCFSFSKRRIGGNPIPTAGLVRQSTANAVSIILKGVNQLVHECTSGLCATVRSRKRDHSLRRQIDCALLSAKLTGDGGDRVESYGHDAEADECGVERSACGGRFGAFPFFLQKKFHLARRAACNGESTLQRPTTNSTHPV
jgi:hypothetical protein